MNGRLQKDFSTHTKFIVVSTPQMEFVVFTGNVNLAQDGVYISGSNTPAYQGSTFTISGAPAAPVAVTPEPSSLALLGTGVLGMAGVLKRRLA